MRRLAWILFAAAGLLASDKRSVTTATNSVDNDHVEIQATVLLDKDDIAREVGAPLPAGIIVVKIKATPKGEDPLSLGRDDFTLVSHKDGQRSGPYAPSQIAGRDVMVVRQTTLPGGGVYGGNQGPVWGGGPGTMGRPQQMPGNGGGVGNAGNPTGAEATVQRDENPDKPNPLLDTLKAKTLPDTLEIKEPVSGLLYFPLEGKQKTKDLEIIYKGPGGRLLISFK